MTRIKEDIVREVMTKVSIQRTEARKLVESLIKLVKNTLASCDGVMISGFREFKAVHKQARMGRNPKTKVEHIISERNVVTFHSSKTFKLEQNHASG